MASTYSTNLKIELMATGENSGTWGGITNTNLGTALEQAIVGYGNPEYLSDATLTISLADSNAAQIARALVLNVTSVLSLTTTRELVVPTIQKQYIVQNNTTGGQSITVKTSGGTGITVPNGRKAHLYVDGTNVIQMFDFVDINGGAIDGTTVGASSASTGAFTTLTASGATTLNGAVALGDAAADLITVPGTVNSNVIFTDNTFDIGASGATRPRTGYFATSVVTPLATVTTVNATTIDTTNLEVTNIKAKDGTASMTLADSTGAVTIATALTANGGAVFNENGADVDFRVEGDTDANLLFVDASTDRVGIGTNAPGSKLHVSTSGAGVQDIAWINNSQSVGVGVGSRLVFTGTTNNNGLAAIDGVFAGATTADGGYMVLSTRAATSGTLTERLRITSTGTVNIVGGGTPGSTQAVSFNGSAPVDSLVLTSGGDVGIGTASPGAKLHVTNSNGSGGIQIGTNSGASQYQYINFGGAIGGTDYAWQIGRSSNSSGLGGDGAFYWYDLRANATRMSLDSSGNLGLGVTPSAWGSDFRALNVVQFSTRTAALFGGSGRTGLGLSLGVYHNNTNWIASVSSAPVAVYEIDGNGAHTWSTYNGTVTAGNAISFTQAMTLDANGSLAVGGTTVVTSNGGVTATTTASGSIATSLAMRNAGTANGSGSYLNFRGVSNTGAEHDYCYLAMVADDTTAKTGSIRFSTTAGSSPVERARITSGGDFRVKGAGTAGSTEAFQVSGSAPADAARIDSSGNLLVGTTSPNAKLTVLSTSASTTNAYIENNAANYTGAGIYSVLTGSGNNNTTAVLFAGYNITNGDVFRVHGNGNVVNYNNSYGAISDVKLKENIVDATPKLERLNQVRIVNFNMIGDEQKQLGVIAQELEQIFPGMVNESPDRDKEGNDLGTTTKSVKYSVFVPMLIKAMQEQQAMINELKAEVAALKGA